MKYIDKYGMIYKIGKKSGNYYLLVLQRMSNQNREEYKVEVKGKKNILTFIKNNGLKRCDNNAIK